MADIINVSSGYQTGSIDTATTLVDNVSPTAAKHINGPATAIIQIETILGSGTTLKGATADLATRLAVPLESSGKLKDFSSSTKTTFPIPVAESGTGATSFTDGAVLVGNGTGAVQALALPSGLRILSHSGTAGQDPSWIAGLLYQGPISCGSGSTRSHEGSVTVSSNGDYSGIHYYTDFTLNSSVTMTVPAGKRRLIIVASGTITINGTINASGAGGAGSSGADNANTADGKNGTDQAGGSGGVLNGLSGVSSGSGGNVLGHGAVLVAGGAGVGPSTAGNTPSQASGSDAPWPWMGAAGGGGGSGGISSGAGGGNGGTGGGSVVLIAPSVVLASTATINTSGTNGSVQGSTGGGGGGAGNVYICTRSYTDNGCIFTLTAGTGGGTTFVGGNGAAGVKQINIYA